MYFAHFTARPCGVPEETLVSDENCRVLFRGGKEKKNLRNHEKKESEEVQTDKCKYIFYDATENSFMWHERRAESEGRRRRRKKTLVGILAFYLKFSNKWKWDKLKHGCSMIVLSLFTVYSKLEKTGKKNLLLLLRSLLQTDGEAGAQGIMVKCAERGRL